MIKLNIRSQISEIVDVLTLFLFIFGVQFKHIPMSTSKIIIAFAFIYAFIKVLGKKSLSIVKTYSLSSIMILGLLFCAVFSEKMHGTGDTSVTYSVVLLLVEDLFGCLVIYSFLNRNNNYSFDKFVDQYIYVCLLQVCIILAMLLVPSVKNAIWSIMKTDFSVLNERYHGIRGLGLAGSLTYDLGAILSFSLCFIAYRMSQKNYKAITWEIIEYILILFAVAITGRTGFIGFGMSLVYSIYHNSKIGRGNKVLKLVMYFTFIILLLVFVYQRIVPDDLRRSIERYALEFLQNYETSGKASVYSVDVLRRMYYLPEASTLLFGDGYYVDPYTGLYYKTVDAGYMRMIFYWGIFPCILLYGLYIYWYKQIKMRLTDETDRYIRPCLKNKSCTILQDYVSCVHGNKKA